MNQTKNYRKTFIYVLSLLIILVTLSCIQFEQQTKRPIPAPQPCACAVPTPERLFIPPDPRNPLPPEMLANRDQTNGVIVGGVILVLIIVGGTLNVIRYRH